MRYNGRPFVFVFLWVCLVVRVPSVCAEADFDLLTTLDNDQSVFSDLAKTPQRYIEEVMKDDAVYSHCFRQLGDIYKFYDTGNPPLQCLFRGTCYNDHRWLIDTRQRAEFLPEDFSVDKKNAESLLAVYQSGKLRAALAANIEKFVEAITQVKKVSIRGNTDAPREVWIFRSGHASEVIQEKTIDALLSRFPGEFKFVYVHKSDYPEIFSLIGNRWHSAILYNGTLIKDFINVEQWMEFFFGKIEAPEKDEGFADIPLFDAHEHVPARGEKRFLELASDNGVAAAVIMTLPAGRGDYQGLAEGNEALMRFAKENPGKFVPLVFLAPSDKRNLAIVQSFHKQGAKGVKLINGQGDYFAANTETILDTPELREVFQYCQDQGLPVLWHVNTHLFTKGFFKVLRDYPRLKVINPHFMGYLTEAPNIVRRLLETYPNLYLDISLGVEPMYVRRSFEDLSAKNKEWRALFIDFSDRFLFGLDMVVHGQTSRAHARLLYRLYRSMLEKESFDYMFFPDRGYNYLQAASHFHQGLNGLHLPSDVLKKIYWDNSVAMYGLPTLVSDEQAVATKKPLSALPLLAFLAVGVLLIVVLSKCRGVALKR